MKKRRLRKEARSRKLPPVLDWLVSIILIICFVILINMFVFQNYRIPSASMVPTLLEEDLIFVEKMTFGPEILPGAFKLPAGRVPERGEVVSFESRRYAEDGPFLELVYRFVYFVTLARVNLKTDRAGDPVIDLLIKRVTGRGGESLREFPEDVILLKPECETDWSDERVLYARQGMPHLPVADHGLPRPALYLRTFALYLERITAGARPGETIEVDVYRGPFERTPDDFQAGSDWLKKRLGFYVPHGCFAPLGDNRGNSTDARVYGPVGLDRIQGKALFRFFPFKRFGLIE
jgi:signal peptidase I